MKKLIFIILFIIFGCSQAQTTYYTDFGGTYLYTWRLGNIDSNVTIWWDISTNKLKLMRPVLTDTVEFSFSSFDTTANYHLTGVWTFDSTIVGTSQRALNLSAGGAFSIPYQSGSNTTTFYSLPVNKVFARADGTFIPGNPDAITGLTFTNANTAQSLVWRDGSGNFSAGTITATLSGNASTATSATSATTSTHLAGGGAYSIPYQSNTNTTTFYSLSANKVLARENGTFIPGNPDGITGLTFTNANTAQSLVWRDGSGNFSAGTITATLSGNASTATSATSATTATNIAGGALNNIPIQTGAGATSFITAPSGSDVLVLQYIPGDAVKFAAPPSASESANYSWTGTHSFGNDASFADDIKVPWESATIDGSYQITLDGKASITVNPTGGSTNLDAVLDSPTDGQTVTIMNIHATNTVTIRESGGYFRMPGTTLVLGQYDTATFRYYATAGEWICIAYTDN